MELVKKVMLPLTLSLGVFSGAASADEFAGYVTTVATGPQVSTTYDMALIGMSSTDGGAVERYIFMSDEVYLNMVVSARANHELVSVAHEMGVANGVYYR